MKTEAPHPSLQTPLGAAAIPDGRVRFVFVPTIVFHSLYLGVPTTGREGLALRQGGGRTTHKASHAIVEAESFAERAACADVAGAGLVCLTPCTLSGARTCQQRIHASARRRSTIGGYLHTAAQRGPVRAHPAQDPAVQATTHRGGSCISNAMLCKSRPAAAQTPRALSSVSV
jgi:hypothetical protein